MPDKLSSSPLPAEVRELAKQIHSALRVRHEKLPHEHPLYSLRIVQRAHLRYGDWQKALNAVLDEAMKKVSADSATLLEDRFIHNVSVLEFAHRKHISEPTVHRRQGEAIEALASVIYEQEQGERQRHQARLESRLEAPTYTTLFGVDQSLDKLAELLHPTAPTAIIAISGLGGMGKTALADALTRRLIAQDLWAEVGWVTARQTVLDPVGRLANVNQPALKTEALVSNLHEQLLNVNIHRTSIPPEAALVNLEQHLEKAPHLIVIDNLETVLDLESLLPILRRLAPPTKFLLTTRHNLFGEVIAHLNVPELVEADALRLVRHEAQLRYLPDVVNAADTDLHPIYATVGGNPLALRLVVGQLHIYPLDTILADLRSVRGATLEKLYHFIYEQAWQSLNDQERRTLLALLMAKHPIRSLEMLVNDSLLTQAEVQQALARLVTLNLVESRGGLRERAYSLHGLTRTFLHEALAWHP